MIDKKIGIIGYGSMGKMLLLKLSESGKVKSDNLFIANRTISKIDEAPDRYVICSTNSELAISSDIILMHVKKV